MSSQQDPTLVPIRAVVTKVEENYVVAYPIEDCGDLRMNDSVTFSLSFWEGDRDPQCEQVVELFGTTLFIRGWRAERARPVIPTKQSATKQLARRA